MHSRPRAQTSTAVPTAAHDAACSSTPDPPFDTRSPSLSYSGEYFSSPDPPSPSPNALFPLRKTSDSDDNLYTDSSPSRSFLRPPKGAALPDPSHFPDPYPFRAPHQYLSSTPPTLSSGGSSTASTRSSAYTSSGSALASGDYGNHFQIASGDDDEVIGVGITSDEVVHLLKQESPLSTSVSQSRAPIDQTRWSQSYSASLGSRSSLVRSNSTGGSHEKPGPSLNPKPSYDLSWQAVDERDEVDLTSEGETEETDLEEDEEEREEERTAAVVVAEEGRGLIVHGEGVATVTLQVQPGTTHLLVGSSSTPSALPLFLTNTLINVGNTLLALDISANFLGALPPALESCVHLEELNVSSNPLRALPLFVAQLTSLRVLIADSTGISTLPAPFLSLDKLHTLSVRRNKMYSLPNWLCLLSSLETLLVDGNPFQGPWKALVDPLLSKDAVGHMYPPSTPIFPLPSATTQDSESVTDTDVDELSDSPALETDDRAPEDEDTMTPARAMLERAATSPAPVTPVDSIASTRGVTRTRTTPNRAYFDRTRKTSDSRRSPAARTVSQHHTRKVPDSGYFGDHEVRRMKSAGELRPTTSPIPPSPQISQSPKLSELTRPALSQYGASASSSNLLSPLASGTVPPRFASLGVAAGSSSRLPLDKSLWDGLPPPADPSPSPLSTNRNVLRRPKTPPSKGSSPESSEKVPSRQRSRSSRKDEKDKDKDKNKESSGKWGFLKKMSMSKLRTDSPSSRPSTAAGRPGATPLSGVAEAAPRSMSSPMLTRLSNRIDVRLSSAGTLGIDLSTTPVPVSPAIVEPEPEPRPASSAVTITSPLPSPSPSPNFLSASSSNFLAPTTQTSRVAKRRSFLPIDGPPTLSIPVPSAAAFLPGLSVTSGNDDDARSLTPSPVPSETIEQVQRREEERAREAYTRALRSVMAYLRDMNDLSLAQQPQQPNPMSIYGAPAPDVSGSGSRSRRPTLVDSGRGASDMASSTASIISSSGTDQLRSMESITRLQNLSASHSVSVATTDSEGSGGAEERQFKDDSSKRALIIREIVETERTYVKGMQELVDIYIKPAHAPVNLLGGVSSAKETVVPAAERKIVFSGLDALFSFHKESFLPALEFAAAPVLKPAAVLAKEDPDGHITATAAKAVASAFISHAAFMKMYSSYINNFDHSVQRIKHWLSDRPTTGTTSPSSINGSPNLTSQVVGAGLMLSGVNSPGLVADVLAGGNGATPLTSSQRRRIKSYLKRCRLNPRHSQLNLEGYLLLPVQRIPRYRMLLEELGRSTPPTADYVDPLDKAVTEISSLATNMNEGKRESESRRKLVQWQARIRGKFPSPLVQPHRRLIMDGPLLLTRVVRKATIAFEVINSQGDTSNVQVECLSPEQTPRSLIGILCNDLLVLCRDPSEGKDPHSPVDLWAVLRMQTLPQPASIVHGNVLRLVDNKAILYFEALSTSVALTWFRAINLHIPTSKT